MNGYIPPQRTREIEATFEAAEGAEPFRATIVTSLTFAEIEAIPFHEDARWSDIFKAIAPYVVAWNAMGRNLETGEYEQIAPPAEAGPNQFRAVPTDITFYLLTKLKTVHLGDEAERPKALTRSDDTLGGGPEKTSDSTSTTTKTSRQKSQRTSTE